MLLGKSFLQERIANGTREGNVNDPTVMDMADFRVCEAELTTSEAMRVNGDPRPRRYGIFEFLPPHKHDSYHVGCLSKLARLMLSSFETFRRNERQNTLRPLEQHQHTNQIKRNR